MIMGGMKMGTIMYLLKKKTPHIGVGDSPIKQKIICLRYLTENTCFLIDLF
jgi:hypothetical protein